MELSRIFDFVVSTVDEMQGQNKKVYIIIFFFMTASLNLNLEKLWMEFLIIWRRTRGGCCNRILRKRKMLPTTATSIAGLHDSDWTEKQQRPSVFFPPRASCLNTQHAAIHTHAHVPPSTKNEPAAAATHGTTRTERTRRTYIHTCTSWARTRASKRLPLSLLPHLDPSWGETKKVKREEKKKDGRKEPIARNEWVRASRAFAWNAAQGERNATSFFCPTHRAYMRAGGGLSEEESEKILGSRRRPLGAWGGDQGEICARGGVATLYVFVRGSDVNRDPSHSECSKRISRIHNGNLHVRQNSLWITASLPQKDSHIHLPRRLPDCRKRYTYFPVDYWHFTDGTP